MSYWFHFSTFKILKERRNAGRLYGDNKEGNQSKNRVITNFNLASVGSEYEAARILKYLLPT